MVDIYVHYEGGLHCVAKHGPSGAQFSTDAPVDNQGRGTSFSPTDLIATGLGACILTTMGILANKQGWSIEGMDVHVQKEMTKTPPRRIDRLPTTLTVPASVASKLDAAARAALEQCAHTCPVRISLLPAIDVPMTFVWG